MNHIQSQQKKFSCLLTQNDVIKATYVRGVVQPKKWLKYSSLSWTTQLMSLWNVSFAVHLMEIKERFSTSLWCDQNNRRELENLEIDSLRGIESKGLQDSKLQWSRNYNQKQQQMQFHSHFEKALYIHCHPTVSGLVESFIFIHSFFNLAENIHTFVAKSPGNSPWALTKETVNWKGCQTHRWAEKMLPPTMVKPLQDMSDGDSERLYPDSRA